MLAPPGAGGDPSHNTVGTRPPPPLLSDHSVKRFTSDCESFLIGPADKGDNMGDLRGWGLSNERKPNIMKCRGNLNQIQTRIMKCQLSDSSLSTSYPQTYRTLADAVYCYRTCGVIIPTEPCNDNSRPLQTRISDFHFPVSPQII